MKVTFEDIELENLVLKHQSKTYKKYLRDSKFLNALDRIYFIMQSEKDTAALKNYSFLHYEKLKRVNMSSVRVLNGKVELRFISHLLNIMLLLVYSITLSNPARFPPYGLQRGFEIE